jgi:hypothetical protein
MVDDFTPTPGLHSCKDIVTRAEHSLRPRPSGDASPFRIKPPPATGGTAGTAPKDSRAYGCRGSFHPVWNRFWLEGGDFALAPGSCVEPTKANRYRETALGDFPEMVLSEFRGRTGDPRNASWGCGQPNRGARLPRGGPRCCLYGVAHMVHWSQVPHSSTSFKPSRAASLPQSAVP